jgi:hypothetical protein
VREDSWGDIHPLRPPELEETAGECRSRWVLDVEAPAEQQELTALAARLSAETPTAAVDLTRTGPHTVRLDLRLAVSPLEIAAFPLVDLVFGHLHAALGVVGINDAPRHHWRTGRQW